MISSSVHVIFINSQPSTYITRHSYNVPNRNSCRYAHNLHDILQIVPHAYAFPSVVASHSHHFLFSKTNRVTYIGHRIPTTHSVNSFCITRPPHITINSRTKGRKAHTSDRSSLGSSTRGKHTTCDTTSHNSIREIIFGAETFDTALGTTEYCTDLSKVLCGRKGALTHVFQACF